MFHRLLSIDKYNSHWHHSANTRQRAVLALICPHKRFSVEIKAKKQPPTWQRAHKQGNSLLRFRGSQLASIRRHLPLTVCLGEPTSRGQLSLKISRRRHFSHRMLFGKRLNSKSKSLFRSYTTLFPLAQIQQQVVACLPGIDMLPLCLLLLRVLPPSDPRRYDDSCRLAEELHAPLQITFMWSRVLFICIK